jgi:replicative DNA helicase Mcm
MEQPLISRFDIIFGLADKQNEERDRKIAQTQHDVAAGDYEATPEVEYGLLREYIAYARQIEPQYASEAVKDKLIDYYTQLRKEAEDGDEPGPRHNDSLRRLAQASARVRLSDEIEMEDAQRAIDMFKFTIGQIGLDEDGKVSGTQLDGGEKKPESQEERIEHVKDVINQLEGENAAPVEEIIDTSDLSDTKTEKTIDKLSHRGEIYEPQTDSYRTT